MDPDTVPREMFDLAVKLIYVLSGVVVAIFGGAWTVVKARISSSESARKRLEADMDALRRIHEENQRQIRTLIAKGGSA